MKQCSDILKLCHLDSKRVLIQVKVDDLMKEKNLERDVNNSF